MPDDEQPETEPVEPVVDPHAAELAKRDAEMAELRASYAQMREDFAHVKGGYDAILASNIANNRPTEQPKGEPELVDVADSEWEAADGNAKETAALVRRQSRIDAKREARLLRDTELRPLAERVDGSGIPIMAQHAQQLAALSLDPKSREIYLEHKKEVDEYVSKLPAQTRLTPEAFEHTLWLVAGKSYLKDGGLEKAVNEEVERRMREGGAPVIQPGGKNLGRSSTATQAPDYDAMFGPAGAAWAKEMGGYDAVAQHLGYPDMETYVKEAAIQ